MGGAKSPAPGVLGFCIVGCGWEGVGGWRIVDRVPRFLLICSPDASVLEAIIPSKYIIARESRHQKSAMWVVDYEFVSGRKCTADGAFN